jgi:phage FluMu gp28-like protein
MGQDFARSGDLSVIAPMEIGETLHRTVPFLMEMHNVPFKQQEQVLFAIGDALPRLCGVAIDSRGNGSYMGEAATDKWGSIVDQVMATENWYRERMPRYKARFEDGSITIPKDDGLVDDHRAFKLVRGVARLPEGKTSGERHGDGAMACVLADHAAEMEAVEIDFTPAPLPGVSNQDDDSDNIDMHGFGIGGGAW